PQILYIFPYTTLFRSADDQVLRHRLGGRARLAHDVEQRATHVEPLEERPDGRRIDVVEHVQPRIVVALLIAQLVPVRLQQRLLRSEEHTSELQSRENL